tara:strand:- start:19 stop:654 length:636 start_codon:yes stop_codon:yes gene_type:complete
MSNNINSASGALFTRTTIITNKKNPANTNNYLNGIQGRVTQSRIPVNLGNNNKLCDPGYINISNIPQPSVTNISSRLKQRTNRCTNGVVTQYNDKCSNQKVKLQNPLNFTASAYINYQSTKNSQCNPNLIDTYKDFSNNCYTVINNGVSIQESCVKPIVKNTNTPSTSTFLRTQYFKKNCLPLFPSSSEKGGISTIKIMRNNNCGVSNGGC